MIIETWVCLAIIAAFVQIFLAAKKKAHYMGAILPICFLAFAIYAWIELSDTPLVVGVKLSFMIPPVFLMSLFELVYWKTQWKEREGKHEK